MTPAARVQAAIEVLDAIDDSRRPADRLMRAYLRERRYIGSKDRRAIREQVYRVLRHRGALDWLISSAGGRPSARTRAMAWHSRGEPESDVESLFAGVGYGPPPLSPDELSWVSDLSEMTLDQPDMPPAARANCPAWLYPPLEEHFGAETTAELAALNTEATVDLRVNEARADRDQSIAALHSLGVACAATPLSPVGIRLEGHVDVTHLPLHRDGLVEIQDEGAQIAALLVDVRQAARIVDLCAGAGGKTLAMAARATGELIACDSDPARLGRMAPRLARAGVTGVRTVAIAERGDAWIEAEAGSADRVLVDAPCSGTGTWRREPESRWRLSAELLAEHQARQDHLLEMGARLVKPGGRLVYVTCSLLRSENEDRVERFLSSQADFALLPVGPIWASAIGGAPPADGPALILTPARHGTDGFFVAVLERTG